MYKYGNHLTPGLADISNIRRLGLVIMGGRIVDIDALPTNPIALDWSAGAPKR